MGTNTEKEISGADAAARIDALELKITHLDDMIDELNKTVYRQSREIDDLKTVLREYIRRLNSLEAGEPINERPPHY